MRIKKIIALGLFVISFVSLFAISVNAAVATQITPGIPEFRYNIDDAPSGHADFRFGTVDTTVYYNLQKGNLFNETSISGSCWASGSDAKASEIWVRVWTTNWLTGEHLYEEDNAALAGSGGYAFSEVAFDFGLWEDVTKTYHEGTVVHQDGSRSVMWVSGVTN